MSPKKQDLTENDLRELMETALNREPELALRGFGSGWSSSVDPAEWPPIRDAERAQMLSPAGLAAFERILTWPGWTEFRRKTTNYETSIVMLDMEALAGKVSRGYLIAAAIAHAVPYRKVGGTSRDAHMGLKFAARASLRAWLHGGR